MGDINSNNNTKYTLKNIIEYKGNDEEYKILNEKLNTPFKYELIFKGFKKKN